jgi:hypothetical protein
MLFHPGGQPRLVSVAERVVGQPLGPGPVPRQRRQPQSAAQQRRQRAAQSGGPGRAGAEVLAEVTAGQAALGLTDVQGAVVRRVAQPEQLPGGRIAVDGVQARTGRHGCPGGRQGRAGPGKGCSRLAG